MAGRLTAAGSRVLGGQGAAARAAASALRHRAGMGLPVGRHIVPDKPLPTNDELVWDNGTPFPEPCIDRLAPHIGKYEALAWLCGGLGFFATLGLAATLNDKASKIPYMKSPQELICSLKVSADSRVTIHVKQLASSVFQVCNLIEE
uniref:NADH dehydrogenase [ubiquinone] 1 beta subcomplex subunit 8, mitochondrial n=1 Tax=Oryza glaberrima TaxID=4538 RepID=I1QVR9_ORYGL